MTKDTIIKLNNLIEKVNIIQNELKTLVEEIKNENQIEIENNSEFTLDKTNYILLHKESNKKMNLTITEFKILEFLFINRPCVMSTSEIHKNIYLGEEYIEELSNAISTHICRINNKLRCCLHVNKSIIRSRHGFGYFIK
jgi:DNA-binding response OmpR family regulator